MSVGCRSCPKCGGQMYVQRASGVYWCDECEREFWKEGDSWWSCDESGDPELVTVVADGGSSSWERTYVCPDCEREADLSGEMDEDRTIVVIGCGDGHNSRDMVRKSRYRDTDSGRFVEDADRRGDSA